MTESNRQQCQSWLDKPQPGWAQPNRERLHSGSIQFKDRTTPKP